MDTMNAKKAFHPKEVIRILMVEDSPLDAFLLNHMLDGVSPHYDYYFTISTTLKDAFQRLDRSSFDLAFLDLNLPDMTGLASITALKAHAPNLPIIIYSGMDDPYTTEEALRCGAKQFIVKGRASSRRIQSAIESVIG
jgi:DNA-binding NarL/FixJ family response regulator